MPTPPSENPARGFRGRGPLRLPAEGRQGEPPPWPLAGRTVAAEREAWAQLWRTPQSVAWEQLGWVRVVARYCRLMIAAERKDAPATLQTSVIQLEDRLGLTPKAMRLLLWSIVEDETASRREQQGGAATGTEDAAKEARRRFRAVEGGGGVGGKTEE